MRRILHCDLNNFFASVETLSRPELKNVPMAVGGLSKRSVILAKNEFAKKYNIKTGESIFSALKKCKDLVIVDSHYDEYIKYSKLVQNVYLKYTDYVEPFSIDECFLDVTSSILLYGDNIADIIREDVFKTTGLTISVGDSFNKSLAKLASDMKKPNATTRLDYNNFKKKIYQMDVGNIIYVGKAFKELLHNEGIYTIGELAHSNKDKIYKLFGVQGVKAYEIALGIDNDEVRKFTDKVKPKSISKGTTFEVDTNDILFLVKEAKDICFMLSKLLVDNNCKTKSISLTIKDSKFNSFSRQHSIGATYYFDEICNTVINLLKENYSSKRLVRMITINCNNLVFLDDEDNKDKQLNLFDYEDNKKGNLKKDKAIKVLQNINKKYGDDKVKYGSNL